MSIQMAACLSGAYLEQLLGMIDYALHLRRVAYHGLSAGTEIVYFQLFLYASVYLERFILI
jgi:hypothetical protein